MGTNTMVAAVGLVIGPGARRRARRDLVAVGLLVQRPASALAGCVWGWLVLEERSGRSEERGLDLLGVTTYVIGLTGLVLRAVEGRPHRLGRTRS